MEAQIAYLPGLKKALRGYLNAEKGVLDVLVEMYGSAADAVKNMKPVHNCVPFVQLVHACKDQYYSKMDDDDVKAACSEQYKGPKKGLTGDSLKLRQRRHVSFSSPSHLPSHPRPPPPPPPPPTPASPPAPAASWRSTT